MGEPGRATEEALDTEPQFVHLHTHSHYSLLTCPVRPEALVQAAAADGQKALALTDNGNLFGAIEFYKACKSEGIKPILGMSAYYAGASSLEKRGNNNPTYQLTLLACSQEGFENLKRLSTHGHVHGFHYQARIDQEVLARHSEGILVLSGGTDGPIERQILSNNMAGAKATAESLQQALGEGNFYLELMSNGSETQDMANQGLLQIHRETGIPVVATNDVHYLTQSDWGAQQVMLCIRDGKTLNDPSRFQMRSHELFLKSRAEMVATFQTIDGAIENSLAIAERCNVEIQFNVYHLPIFDTETDESPDQAVVRIVNEGAKKRYRDITPTIRKRIDYEL